LSLTERIDAAFEAVAPVHAARRQRARLSIKAMGDGYDTAKPGRTQRMFGGRGGGPDAHQDTQTLHQLREQCRHHDRNNGLLSGLLNTAADEVIGPEFFFKPTTLDEDWNNEAEAFLRREQEPDKTDARGELTFTEQVKLTLRADWTDGDILHVWQPDGTLYTYEAHELATPRDKDGANIVNGVRFDARGRAIAYYVPKPGQKPDRGWLDSSAQLQTIPAKDALFVATRKRFNQSRGVPYLAPILGTFNRLDGYLDAETFAAEVNAHWAAVIKREPIYDEDAPAADIPGSLTTPTTSKPGQRRTADRVQEMPRGAILDMMPGESLDIVQGTRPGGTFEPFVILVCRIVGVGVGFPLELFLKDFSRTNYSSARASMNVARRSARGWQVHLEHRLCTPWYRRHITRAIASGALRLPRNTPDLYAYQPGWPAWAQIDPEKEIKADVLAIANRLKSRGEVIRGRKGDPDATFTELEQEEARLRDAGLIESQITPAPPAPGA